MNKIVGFDEMAARTAAEKTAGRKVVLCHGVFDLMHIGHIRYLRQARQRGDFLAVTLTPDRYVDKGPGRPAFSEQLRAESLAALATVDMVALNPWPTAEKTLDRLRPDIYAKGSEFKNPDDDPTGKIGLEIETAKRMGVEVVFIEDVVFSSSNLINRYLEVYPEELRQYLDLLRQRHRLAEVLERLDRLREPRVLVVGDAIIDQYVYCTPLGLSSKDPTLAVRRLSEEGFPGGAIAVARHVAGLGGRVTLLTRFGADCPHLPMVRRALPPNLGLVAHDLPGQPTVVKRRYLDGYSLAKFLEIYEMAEDDPPPEAEERFSRDLRDLIADHDLVLAADFGHRAIGPGSARLMADQARYLAVNTQANAGNRGYHTVFRYPRADLVSLAGHEISLAFQDNHSADGDLMERLARRLGAATVVLTRGSQGVKILRGDFLQAPAVAARVVDRVGAGDALFAAAALAAFQHWPLDLMGLLANLAGAALVETVGNNAAIDLRQLRKSFTAMLK